jgi:hypothetical protein
MIAGDRCQIFVASLISLNFVVNIVEGVDLQRVHKFGLVAVADLVVRCSVLQQYRSGFCAAAFL